MKLSLRPTPKAAGLVSILCLCLAACAASSGSLITPTATHPPPAASSEHTAFPTSTLRSPATHTPKTTPSSTTGPRLCSPLAGYSREELIAAISNPFRPPSRPGSDDPHQAIDLSVTHNGMALAGDPVQAVMSGRVAGVISERFPYGNALMIETPLDESPDDWILALKLPTPAPTLPPHPALTCPQVELPPPQAGGSRSLYLLYAHLGDPPALRLDEAVDCGVQIGVIGDSGNALHPHLHLEARIGPSGLRFLGMGHYETRASAEEMGYYCLWRVSGVFQLLDPLPILEMLP